MNTHINEQATEKGEKRINKSAYVRIGLQATMMMMMMMI